VSSNLLERLFAPAEKWATDTLIAAGLPTDAATLRTKYLRQLTDGTIIDDLPGGRPHGLLNGESAIPYSTLIERRYGRGSDEADAYHVLYELHAIEVNWHVGDHETAAYVAVRLSVRMAERDLSGYVQEGLAAVERRKRGGRAPKKREGIQAAVNQMHAADPGLTAKAAWRKIPKKPEPPMRVPGYEIHRDDERVWQVDGRTGRRLSIKFSTFRDYLPLAKNAIKNRSN